MRVACLVAIATTAQVWTHSNADAVLSIGMLIMGMAVVASRYRQLRNTMMNSHVEAAVSTKAAAGLMIAGNGLQLTMNDLISAIGLVLTTIGAVFIFMNWRINKANHQINKANAEERKRANDLKERELRNAGVKFEEDQS